jgi:hypothetical protein
MKARRIKIKKGEKVEISFKQPQQTRKAYSSVGVADMTIEKEQQVKTHSGLKGDMVIHGPASISLIRSKKIKKTTDE